MKKIKLLIRLINAVIDLNKFNNVHSSMHNYAKNTLENLISSYELEKHILKNGRFLLKAQWYIADSLYICEKLSNLHDIRVTEEEKYLQCLSGVLIAVSDRIIDDMDYDMERVHRMKDPLNDFSPRGSLENFYVKCYSDFVSRLPVETKNDVIFYYEKMYEAQIESKRQFQESLTRDEVDKICKEKFAYMLIFLRLLLPSEMQPREKEWLSELGGFLQYGNDIGDLHKDLKAGIKSFASARETLKEMSEDIETQRLAVMQTFEGTDYREKQQDEFMFILYCMHMAVQAKLFYYDTLCDKEFTLDKFKSLRKKSVRAMTKPYRLFLLAMGKVFTYDYKSLNKRKKYFV